MKMKVKGWEMAKTRKKRSAARELHGLRSLWKDKGRTTHLSRREVSQDPVYLDSRRCGYPERRDCPNDLSSCFAEEVKARRGRLSLREEIDDLIKVWGQQSNFLKRR